MKKYAFGIDIGGTTVKIGLFSEEGDLTKKWEIPTRKDNGGCYILSDIAKSVEEEMKRFWESESMFRDRFWRSVL